MTVPNCQLCLQPLNSSSLRNRLKRSTTAQGKLFNKSVKHLWSYLYHQNVRETLSPSPTASTKLDKCELPTLAFSLYWGGNQNHHRGKGQLGGEETVQLCRQCYEHIDKLDQLHQQLEQVKRLVEDQVKKIDHLCQGRKEGGRYFNNNTLHSVFQSKLNGPHVSLAGTSVGKDNISQLAQFLTTICHGIQQTGPADRPAPKSQRKANLLAKHEKNNVNTEAYPKANRKFTERLENMECTNESGDEDEAGADRNYQDENSNSSSSEEGNNQLGYFKVKLERVDEDDVQEEDSTDFVNGDDDKADEDELLNVPGDRLVENLPSSSEQRRSLFPSVAPPNKKKLVIQVIKRRRNLSNNNPGVCSVCGKKISPKNMATHMRTHTGEKKFECEICTARFSQKSSLNIHRRLHTGECSYACELCPDRFHRKNLLIDHIKKKHQPDA